MSSAPPRARSARARRSGSTATARVPADARARTRPSTGSRTTQYASSHVASRSARSGSCSMRPLEDSAHVVDLRRDDIHVPFTRGIDDCPRARTVGELDQPVGLRTAQRIFLSRRVEAFASELADRSSIQNRSSPSTSVRRRTRLLSRSERAYRAPLRTPPRRPQACSHRGRRQVARRVAARRRRAGRSSRQSSRAGLHGAHPRRDLP